MSSMRVRLSPTERGQWRFYKAVWARAELQHITPGTALVQLAIERNSDYEELSKEFWAGRELARLKRGKGL